MIFVANTRWQDIYNHLKGAGIDVFSPGQHQGDCLSPYVVVKYAGSARFKQYSSTQAFYELLCYIPANQYSILEEYLDQVRTAMRGLQPLIMPTHDELESFYDADVKGHMVSLQYRNNRKIPF